MIAGGCEIADVARILKVIEKALAVHAGRVFQYFMQFEPRQVHAPEFGQQWLNSPPLSIRALRGRVVLIDFWDYTCVNCIHTLPYVREWNRRYRDRGLTVIGVHAPEFFFARTAENVIQAAKEFQIEYPILLDNEYEVWKAFANRYWPAKYLIDKDGYMRYFHPGEGNYAETECMIQQLLREIDPAVSLPPVMEPVRALDKPEALTVCERPTPELYLGYKRGRIANAEGFTEDRIANYQFGAQPATGCYRVEWAVVRGCAIRRRRRASREWRALDPASRLFRGGNQSRNGARNQPVSFAHPNH